MPDALEDVKGYREVPERRSHQRHQIRSLAYIELDEGNGGILLNVSESGLAVQAVTPLMDECLPNMRLQLSENVAPIAAVGQIVWTTNSRKVAGIRFLSLPEEAAGLVKEWIASEDFPLDRPREANFPRENPVAVAEATAEQASADQGNGGQYQSSDSEEEVTVQESAPEQLSEPVFIHLDPHASETDTAVPLPTLSPASRAAASLKKDVTLKPAARSDAASDALSAPHAGSTQSSWLLYTMIGILAVCSTAAGWSVGRTGFYGALSRFHGLHFDADATDTVPSPAAGATKLPGIEIVDLNNRRWFVPFVSPSAETPLATHPQPVASSQAAHQKTVTPDRTLNLTSASRPTVAKPRVADAEAPPTISTQPSGIAGPAFPLAAISGNANPLPPPSPVQSAASAVVEAAQLIHRVEPLYPHNATQLFAGDATIKLHITIGADGQVQNVKPVGGSAMFFDAATTAIRQWRYRPALINGKPSASDAEISIVFRHP
jgi:outer membrane biosynthesis protein TonB